MSLKQVFKGLLLPCAAGATVDGHSRGPNCVKRTEESRPSSLPLYSNECSVCGRSQKKDEPPTQMEEAVGSIRKELWVWQDNIRGYRHKFVEVYRDGFERLDCPGEGVPEKCLDRNHLEHSFDDSCYPLLPRPDTKPPKTKELKNFKCYNKPSRPVGSKEKKVCFERCSREKPPPKLQQNCTCCCCHETSSG